MTNHHLTLREFQESPGIPIDEQIVLINNRKIFDGFLPYRFPLKRKRTLSLVGEFCRFGKSLFSLAGLGKLRSNKIFIGYYDSSFDSLNILTDLFEQIKKFPETRFEILIGKGDYAVEQDLADRTPENVDRIFLNNLNLSDSRFHYLPMGRDFRSIDVFKNRQPVSDKSTLCYCNFSVNTHPARQQVLEMVEDKSFIVKQHLGQFLNYSVTREEFFDALGASKFCICPRGNAYDTFRMWDALYSGTIPIVVREAVFHKLLDDLPILFLNSYDDFKNLSAETLESSYEQMLDRKFNFEKLTASYWLNQKN